MEKIDKLIEVWQEKHSELLSEYNYKYRGSDNLEEEQLIRENMKNMLLFIDDLNTLKYNL